MELTSPSEVSDISAIMTRAKRGLYLSNLTSEQRPYLIAVDNAEFRGTANFENA